MNVSDAFAFVSVVILLVLVAGIFIRISMRLRRGGGSLTTVVLGTTDEFLTHDKSKAAETIVDENAGKKFEDQRSGGPKNPHGSTSSSLI